MADGAYGKKEIYIDLAVTGARVIRDATKNEWVKIIGIRINGLSHATLAAPIVLRCESASGPVIFQLRVPAASVHDGTWALSEPLPPCKGLYMDTQTNAWQESGTSHMIIYTA